MTAAEPRPVGLLGSARRLAHLLLGLLYARAQIFALEAREEKLRDVHLLVWLTITLALGVAGILIAIAVIGFFLWQHTGYAGVIGLGVAVLGGAAGLLLMIRRRILHGPMPFPETIAQIGKDLECLRHHE